MCQAVQSRTGTGVGLRDLVKDEIRAILQVPMAQRASAFSRADCRRQQHGQDHLGREARPLVEVERPARSLCAGTFRAAAVEQVGIWTSGAGVGLIRAKDGADPAAVVNDASASGKARGLDTILIDTAGRQDTRVNLMDGLDEIRRVAAREVEGAPHEVLLVLDATVGQNGLVQAREFMEAAGVNGVILTKLDGTAKGGIAVAVAAELKLPVIYVGVGEAIDDLVPFSPDEYVDALFEQKW